MKKHLQYLPTITLFFVAMCLLISVSVAQAPNGFNYQAAIRNSDGTIRQNEASLMRFTISSGISAQALYQETQVLTTNDYGVVNHVIGTGTAVLGTMSSINWAVGDKYLKIELNTSTSGYITISNSKMQSVPYALFAAETASSGSTSPWIENGNNITNSNSGNVGIGTNNPTSKLDVVGKVEVDQLSINGTYELPTTGPGSVNDVIKYNGTNLEWGQVGSSSASQWSVSGNDISNVNSGKVNIGTFPNNPSRLEIFASSTGFTLNSSSNNSGDFIMSVRTNFGGINAIHVKGNGFVGINNVVPASTFHVRHGDGNGDGISIENAANFNTNRWQLKVHGPTDNLELRYNGTLRGTFNKTNGQFTSNSDLRLKENIVLMEDVMARIMNLEIKRYIFKGDEHKESQFGVIAQEAMIDFPELVIHQISKEEDTYQVNYAGFSMVAIKAIQEQQIQIEELKKQLNDKLKNHEELEQRLLAIESKLLEVSSPTKK